MREGWDEEGRDGKKATVKREKDKEEGGRGKRGERKKGVRQEKKKGLK